MKPILGDFTGASLRSRNVLALAKACILAFVTGLFALADCAQAQTDQMLYSTNGALITWRTDNFDAAAGGYFLSGTNDVLVTHLGYFDKGADGLLHAHPVGVFAGDTHALLGDVSVPAGTSSFFTNGYRWVALATPVVLHSSSYYVLGAQAPQPGSGSPDPGDQWPDFFIPSWNSYFIGGNPVSSREPMYAFPFAAWPQYPENVLAFQNYIYGAGNLASFAIGSATVGVPETQVESVLQESATIRALANGQPPLSFQWYKSPGTILAGKTDLNLVLTALTMGDEGDYYVIVTNSLGSIQSANVHLTVMAGVRVSITAPPTNQTVFERHSATFSVSASGTQPISYQWRRNATPIAAATQSSFTLAAAALTNNGDSYSCVLSNVMGLTNSSGAILTVTPNQAITAQFLHETQDGSRNDYDGTVGSHFTVGAAKVPVTHLGYYDQNRDGLNLAHNVGLFSADGSVLLATVLVPSGTSATLANGYRWVALAPPLVLSENTSYVLAAEVINGDGDGWKDLFEPQSWNSFYVGANGPTTRYGVWGGAWPAAPLNPLAANNTYGAAGLAVLPVGAAVAVIAESSVTQYAGLSVTINATISGQPPVSAQWYKVPATLLSGQTNAALTLANLALGDAGDYYVVASNSLGTNQSSSATLTVLPATPPGITQEPQSQTAYGHQTVEFTVSAAGTPPLSYQWSFGGNPIAGATTNVLTLVEVSAANSGNYRVAITNQFGQTNSAAANLQVLTPPPGSYAAAIWSATPIVYYRFSEVNDGGTTAVNMGTRGAVINGLYEGPFSGVAGPLPPDFPMFDSTNLAVGLEGIAVDVRIPALNLDTNSGPNVTMAAWVNKSIDEMPWTGIILYRGPGGASGLMLKKDANGADMLGYLWGDNFWQFDSGLVLPTNQWAFVALVIEPSKATLYMQDGSGMRTSTASLTHASVPFSDVSYVGWDTAQNIRRFVGAIDEVMIFGRSLSASEVNQLHSGSAPSVRLDLTVTGGNIVLSWPMGTLQQAGQVGGPYTDMTGITSPHTNSPNGPQKFYRVKVN